MRSSSYSRYEFCEHLYYLEYVLGYRFPSGRAANLGNIFHKSVELFALEKLARQTNKIRFTEDESGQSFKTGSMTDAMAAMVGTAHYNKIQKDHVFTEADEVQVVKWLNTVDREFHPSNNKVLAVEKFFELPIEEDWAVLDNGQYLKLFGTIDLLLDRGSTRVNYVDWKTGARKDWATGEVKTLEKLEWDPQLRIYHYAMTRLFPNIREYDMTVYYLADGGPFTVKLTKDDAEGSLRLIRDKFFEIKNNNRPRPIWPDWKCNRLCAASKPMPGGWKSLCQAVSEDMTMIGIDEVTLKWKKGDVKYVGGGRQ